MRAEILARSYKHSQRERTRARVLLLADTASAQGGCKDAAVEAQVGVCNTTVEQVRRRYCESGLDATVFHKEQHNCKARTLDGNAEAFLR